MGKDLLVATGMAGGWHDPLESTASAACCAAAQPVCSQAFPPIVDVVSQPMFSCEALARGPLGEAASTVLRQVPFELQSRFDRQSAALHCTALALAAWLGLRCGLINLNSSPQSLTDSDSPLDSLLQQAQRHQIEIERIVLEVTEDAVIADQARLARLLGHCRALGLKAAIDDFGAGHPGLNLLAEFQPDQVKIDMNPVHSLDQHGPQQAVVRAILRVCTDLGTDAIAEGIETVQEEPVVRAARGSTVPGLPVLEDSARVDSHRPLP